jgi:hypothetical protein
MLILLLVGVYIFNLQMEAADGGRRSRPMFEAVVQACIARGKRRWRGKVHMGREES